MIAKKKEVRRLALTKETLRQLASADLRRAGGGMQTIATVFTWPVRQPR